MRKDQPALESPPDWRSGRRRRLFLSMLISTVLVSAVLSLFRLPDIPRTSPLLRLLVDIVRVQQEPEQPPPTPADDPAEPPVTAPDPAPDEQRPAQPPDAPLPDKDAQTGEPRPDLEAAREAAIEAYLDRLENPPSVNPNVDRLKREFAGRYQPPTQDRPGPVWENVERDSLGRSVLRFGNCWRILDDPNVGSQEAFRTYGQHSIMCDFFGRGPRELPWVEDIRERYPYLKYPDGEIPDQAAE